MAKLYSGFFERLRANVKIVEPSGCWLWIGHCGTNHRPQMSMRINGKHCTCSVQRKVIEQFYLPGRWQASHICTDDTWLCVRPDHMLPETCKQNCDRRDGRPVRPGPTWPKQPGPPPIWLPPVDPDIYAGSPAEEIPF